MNILFLTIGEFRNLNEGSVHKDVVRYLSMLGHNLYVACKNEESECAKSFVTKEYGIQLLHIRTGSLKKTSNSIRKGISTILIERSFINAIKRHYGGIRFDLVLYHTPPVTFANVVRYVKKRDNAASYLLLKDIFPQNAVDLGMLSKKGAKGLVYLFFRMKEKALYRESDYIGCMSPANVKYILSHNTFLNQQCVEVAPNSVFKPSYKPLTDQERDAIRIKYGLPIRKAIFVYGGNLGKPQGIPFLLECLSSLQFREDCHFLIVGSGSDQHLIKEWLFASSPKNVTLLESLPKEDFDILVQASDVGLVFLDHRFTIPNYPSRLLSYLQVKIPVLAATDPVSDIGPIAEKNGYGLWCESDSVESFESSVNRMLCSDLQKMGESGFRFLCENYLVENTCKTILKHFN